MALPAAAPVAERVVEVLKNVSRRPINPRLEHDLVSDLGFDSLQLLEVLAELEDSFDISIPQEGAPRIRTVAQVVEHVAAVLASRSEG
jgi:acyl carrier protein